MSGTANIAGNVFLGANITVVHLLQCCHDISRKW